MTSDKLFIYFKDNSGTASVIEAVLVYPVVILVCSFLIYSGLYMCEESMLCDIAQKTAEYKVDILSFCESKTEDTKDGLKKQDIGKMYEEKRKKAFLCTDSETEAQTERRMAQMLLSPKTAKCRIKTEQMLHGSKVTVSLERTVRMPGVMKLFSKETVITEKAAATELSSDYCKLVSIGKMAGKITGKNENEDERKEENETDDSRK